MRNLRAPKYTSVQGAEVGLDFPDAEMEAILALGEVSVPRRLNANTGDPATTVVST